MSFPEKDWKQSKHDSLFFLIKIKANSIKLLYWFYTILCSNVNRTIYAFKITFVNNTAELQQLVSIVASHRLSRIEFSRFKVGGKKEYETRKQKLRRNVVTSSRATVCVVQLFC